MFELERSFPEHFAIYDEYGLSDANFIITQVLEKLSWEIPHLRICLT